MFTQSNSLFVVNECAYYRQRLTSVMALRLFLIPLQNYFSAITMPLVYRRDTSTH